MRRPSLGSTTWSQTKNLLYKLPIFSNPKYSTIIGDLRGILNLNQSLAVDFL